MTSIKGKNILITGGTGTFGRAFARRLLEAEPAKVIIFSRDEWKQWEMGETFNDPRIRFFLGDVRDQDRLRRAFAEVDIVVHAAALKQVPAAEYNPCEFIKTNVLGAMNIIDAALDCGVDKVLALSSDKAVNPVNLYGATKLCSDKLFVAANVYAGKRGYPRFSVVRYGNVVGSRGSILPKWRKLLDEGADHIPITDERMTRFWITPDQAVQTVLNALDAMEGGEVFVPKVPTANVVDMAQVVAPNLPHKVTGIRPGEKLHELLIPEEEASRTREFDRWYITYPSEPKGGKPLPEGFSYASDTTLEQLHEPALAALLQ